MRSLDNKKLEGKQLSIWIDKSIQNFQWFSQYFLIALNKQFYHEVIIQFWLLQPKKISFKNLDSTACSL